eukprot:CAMPEP_0177435912 /NCGR_PEP_ID=MMETSP0369-20130122/1355_1 /TAXON_ID=447022 ORGANISM="Scrippsiella hangoei-like, Strain SHHI-4" /NCGR_SAMPLE_ID=MMETSP0369 /ASSEMBLY_ACC=CAM_ASM_000364 /LENGTH=239 /DNA_ID=CAMNT_0018907205 /DNA_START=137 /DNA_END=857 /DNA_ORIENTATION=+
MGRRLEQRQLRASAHTAFRSTLGASPSAATSSSVTPLVVSGALASSSSAFGVSPQDCPSTLCSASGASPSAIDYGVCSPSMVSERGVSPQACGASPQEVSPTAHGVSPTVVGLSSAISAPSSSAMLSAFRRRIVLLHYVLRVVLRHLRSTMESALLRGFLSLAFRLRPVALRRRKSFYIMFASGASPSAIDYGVCSPSMVSELGVSPQACGASPQEVSPSAHGVSPTVKPLHRRRECSS